MELFSRQTAKGLLQAVKTEAGFDLVLDGKTVVEHSKMQMLPVPQNKDWKPARDQGIVGLIQDRRDNKKLYGIKKDELELIKDYQAELEKNRPKTIDDLIRDRRSLAQSVGSLNDAIIDKQAKYIDQGRGYFPDTSAMERELKAKSKQLEDFDKTNPQVYKEIKQRKKAEIERFLAID